MKSPAFATIEARLTLSSNDAEKHEKTIKTCVEVVCHLRRRYGTVAVIPGPMKRFVTLNKPR